MNNQDFLVIGSGIAGLFFAYKIAPYGSVTILAKDEPYQNNTFYAQGGIASVALGSDSFESHIQDTLLAGAGICKESVVRNVVTEGPDAINELIALGVGFDRDKSSGEYSLGKEGGHSERRIFHAKDQTGAEIHRALYDHVKNLPNVKILSHHLSIDLITKKNQVSGAYVLNKKTREIQPFSARVTILATGGAGKVYLYTSNPDVATGDGIAMAFRAGAKIANMEFFQFHPTCLYHPLAKSFLITEAMRGEGAVLKNSAGERFMQNYDPRAELASRDIVARSIDAEMKRTGADCVYLDISHRDSEFIKTHFPFIYQRCLSFGIDLTKQAIPVVPAAHYTCGGVVVDEYGATSLPGLYALGEVAATGLHGANRLASNSLLEAVVYAKRATQDITQKLANFPAPEALKGWDHLDTAISEEEVIVSYLWDELRRLMWNLVGIVRSNRRLKLALRRILEIKNETKDYYWKYRVEPDLIELRNLVNVAELVVRSALIRKESRGLHYNLDYPQTDDQNWKKDTLICKTDLV
ncbi:L-aspartate oxidase [bacterium]|nr:L-aspartate oxidase [bacterium]